MNEQQNFWAHNYTEKYVQKNHEFDLNLGIEGWTKMLALCKQDINSILECGCNIGRNIEFLEAILPAAKKSVIEINKTAFEFVTKKYKLANSFNGPIEESELDDYYDLVFTNGVLIHIHPDNLIVCMQKMFNYSNKYILIGEYFNRTPVMLNYQGKDDRLFKRDFGKLFIENFPVKLVDYGFLWGHIYDNAGFDDITWWLFKK